MVIKNKKILCKRTFLKEKQNKVTPIKKYKYQQKKDSQEEIENVNIKFSKLENTEKKVKNIVTRNFRFK